MTNQLPVSKVLGDIKDACDLGPVVITSPPGSGKTTLVPPLVSRLRRGKTIVMQPRRVAAISTAHRLAEQENTPIGQNIGYHVRFSRVGGESTKLWSVTLGMFFRWLQADPLLEEFDTLIFDEFHERQAEGDAALAVCLALRELRPELLIVIMSATIDGAEVAKYLGGTHIHAPGRAYDVCVTYSPDTPKLRLDERVLRATKSLKTTGRTLVFLPTVRLIEQTVEALNAAGLDARGLWGSQSLQEQQGVLNGKCKFICSTNIAETSLTIQGVTAVIDSGTRLASVWDGTGLPKLKTLFISQASADQRAGRAGRLCKGQCVRLWSERSHLRLKEYDEPQIRCTDLSSLVLALISWGLAPSQMKWLTAPKTEELRRAQTLLQTLGLLKDGQLTKAGEAAIRLPLHPRLASFAMTMAELGYKEEARNLAAIMSVKRRWFKPFPSAQTLMQESNTSTRRVAKTLRLPTASKTVGLQQAFAKAMLSAWPDRVCSVADDDRRVANMMGRQLRFPEDLAPGLYIAAGLSPFSGQRFTDATSAIPVHRDWLPTSQQVQSRIIDGQIRSFRTVQYGKLILSEHPIKTDPQQAQSFLVEMLSGKPLHEVFLHSHTQQLLIRIQKAQELDSSFSFDPTWILRELCNHQNSLREVVNRDHTKQLTKLLTYAQHQLLQRSLPERFLLPTRSTVAIVYSVNEPPFVRARIQQLFGLQRCPKIAGQRLRVHLLAPNRRVQQITDDLERFWNDSYGVIRKELRARYAKHAWPEFPTLSDAEDRPKRRRKS